MKRYPIDYNMIRYGEYVRALGILREFKEYWGTQTVTVNGEPVEILTPRLMVYPYVCVEEGTRTVEDYNDGSSYEETYCVKEEHPERTQKFVDKYFDDKAKSDLKGSKKGVRSQWLYLNPFKKPDDPNKFVNLEDEGLALNLTEASKNGITGRIVVGAKHTTGVPTRRWEEPPSIYILPEFTNPISNQPAFIQEFITKYDSIRSGDYPMQFLGTEDKYKKALLEFIIYKNSGFTISSIEQTKSTFDYSIPYTLETYDGYGNTVTTTAYRTRRYTTDAYVVNITIQPQTFSPALEVVTKIMENVPAVLTAYPEEHTRTDTDSDGNSGTYNYTSMASLSDNIAPYWVKLGDYNDLTDGEADGIPYLYGLRTSFFDAPGIKPFDKVNYIFQCLDSDYREKSRSAFETFVTMVIVIAIIVVAIKTGQWAAAKAGAGAITASVTSMAIFLSTVSIVLAIGSFVMYKMDMLEGASALGNLNKLVSTASTVMSVAALIQNLALKASGEAMKQQIAKELGKEVGALTLSEITIGYAKIATAAVMDASFNQWVKTASIGLQVYQYRETKDYEKEMRGERAKLAEAEEALEQSRTNHLALAMSKYEFDPLKRQYNVYDSIYDKPYDWWATPYHSGNMQRTSVNALWLDDAKNGII
jgi:hypothetical protein